MRLFTLAVVLGCGACADQCCFNDGDVISLQADTGHYLGRCNNCIWDEVYADSAFVHITEPWLGQWTVFNAGDGKIVLQADSGNFLARCNNCAPGASYPDEAFVHVDDWTASPWAQWTCVDVGEGKIALQADNGNFLARCKDCVNGAYSQAAFVHASGINDGSWVHWMIESDGQYLPNRCQMPTNAPCTDVPTTTPCANTSTPAPYTGAPTTALPYTDAPTTAPSTDLPIPAPYTNAPTTDSPYTDAPSTVPQTNVPVMTPATTLPATTRPVACGTCNNCFYAAGGNLCWDNWTESACTASDLYTWCGATTWTPTPAPSTTTPTATPGTDSPTTAPSSDYPVATDAPTTQPPLATPSPTTSASQPTSVTPATTSPTTIAPTTVAPPTAAPTTAAPTIVATTTAVPTTAAPATMAPTTLTPTTAAATTIVPTTGSPGPYLCTQPRVRKAWASLSEAEKTTYKDAIAVAMDVGLYQRFLTMHADRMDNMQAHGTCGFMYWHRQYLIGFENMLRSLKPEFACITIPYFDYVNDNTKYMARSCNDMASCSPILNELGSAADGASTTVDVMGYSQTSRCDSTYPLNHFNPNEGTSGALGCVPRGDWTTTYFPSEVSFTSIKQALMEDPNVVAVNRAIETQPHNNIHATLGGIMDNAYTSPADPIFFSHHSMVDALNAIYFKCRVAPLGYSDQQKQSSALGFEGCSVHGESAITAMSAITMRVIVGGTPVNVHDDPSVSPFFKDVPNEYYKLIDNTDLGPNSYSFELSGLVGDLYTKCGAAGLQSQGRLRGLNDVPAYTSGRVENYVVSLQNASHVAKYNGWRTAITSATQSLGWTPAVTETEINKMVVAYYHYCLPGGVHDLSPQDKKMWRVDSVSKQVLGKLLDGSDPIQVPGWQALNAQHFDCSVQPAM
uniref:Secreted protein n=1 Tax=Achlya hypogyna TaxID=1202772 RepID=A0A0A7CPE6_ACHHY|nr:secreted protein [Achlya hypogyna]